MATALPELVRGPFERIVLRGELPPDPPPPPDDERALPWDDEEHPDEEYQPLEDQERDR